MSYGAMHRKPNGPRRVKLDDTLEGGHGFDDVLQAQRERINRLFRLVTLRAKQRFLDTTPLSWSMQGNTKGAWGRGSRGRPD